MPSDRDVVATLENVTTATQTTLLLEKGLRRRGCGGILCARYEAMKKGRE